MDLNETIAAELEETGDSLFDGEFLFDNIEDHSNYTNSSLTNLTEEFLLKNQSETRDVAMMFRAWTDGFLTPVMGSFGILGKKEKRVKLKDCSVSQGMLHLCWCSVR